MVKRQHYVPRFYLRLFAANNKVSYYDKVLKRDLSNMHVDNVAQQRYFYDFSDEFLSAQREHAGETMDSHFFDKQFLENYFAQLEDQFASSFRKVNEKINAQTNLMNLTLSEVFEEEEKIDIAFFMVLQVIRTPAYRELSKNFMGVIGNLLPDFPDNMLDDNERLLMHLSSGILTRVGNYFLGSNFDWYLGVIEGFEEEEALDTRKDIITNEFLISDNPVVNIKHSSKKTNQVSIEFCLPISPKHLIILREKNFPFEKPDNSIFSISKNLVRFYNEYQLRFSTRKVIYSKRPNAKKLHFFFRKAPLSLTHNSNAVCMNRY